MAQQPEIRITDLTLDLAPSEDPSLPLQPVVTGARLRLDEAALVKLAQVAIVQAKGRAPVDVELDSARFTDGGAEINAVVSRGRFMRADVRAVVGVSAQNAERITVEVQDVKALGMLPLDAFVTPVLEKAFAMASAKPGIARASGNARALLVDPAAVLAGMGVPMRFAAPGVWSIQVAPGGLEAEFSAGARE